MNIKNPKRKWNQGILGYPTPEEINFLFDEIDRLEKALADTEELLRKAKEDSAVFFCP